MPAVDDDIGTAETSECQTRVAILVCQEVRR